MNIIQTCGACPEQYAVVQDGRMIGYMRLRHGRFTVECPDSGGLQVFVGAPAGEGAFAEYERDFWLRKGQEAIQEWLDSLAMYEKTERRP
jgi:hypothetical protein